MIMRKGFSIGVMVLMIMFLSYGAGLSRRGNGGQGSSGQGGGGGYYAGGGTSIVCSGDPVTIEGIVSDVSYSGSGMEVDGTVSVYGIGPYWYWDFLGIDRPDVGDEVTVEGMEVEFGGSKRIIAMSITVLEGTAQLRDCGGDAGGRPLWRGERPCRI